MIILKVNCFKYENYIIIYPSIHAMLNVFGYFTLGAAVIAALKNKRNGLCLVSSDDAEFNAKRNLANFVEEK